MVEIKIEKGVPLLPARGNTGLTEALRALAAADIGDSIVLPVKATRAGHTAIVIGGKVWYASRTLPEGGCRVWKIAEPTKREGK